MIYIDEKRFQGTKKLIKQKKEYKLDINFQSFPKFIPYLEIARTLTTNVPNYFEIHFSSHYSLIEHNFYVCPKEESQELSLLIQIRCLGQNSDLLGK